MGTEFEREIDNILSEEVAELPSKKPRLTAKKPKAAAERSQTENKREKLIELSRDGIVEKSFASALGSFNAVESADALSDELLSDKLLKEDVSHLTRSISPNIPFIGLISGGCTTPSM
ncbi:Hypothetical predicted protein [Paramuricea clavata]|uniref:Uncharacterized protein n=1 Tax=Paramuricea clavata TaxID=317549 RepID=A0A7D9IPZ9_PARCT|nr:Hypothetical predicted protein [Paramuricea clavata]